MNQRKLNIKREKYTNRAHYNVRSKAAGKPRVVVFRSLKHIYAQLIDDVAGKTLCSASTLNNPAVSGDKTACAKVVGQELAQKALQAGIVEVCFDRGRFLYHGRVAALADGLREGGLKV